MKKNLKEIIICLLQILIFYLLPIRIKYFGPIGLVLLLLISTFILSIIISSISKKKIKYCYPLFVATIFLPTIFLYYNESALIHSIWYLVVATIGIVLGTIINILKK